MKIKVGEKTIFESLENGQSQMIHPNKLESLASGGRGCGLTTGLTAWMAVSSVDKEFRGLLLSDDVDGIADASMRLFYEMGARTKNLSMAIFPSGARVTFHRPCDIDTLRGMRFRKIGVDWLTRIKKEAEYLAIMGRHLDLHRESQILSTAVPCVLDEGFEWVRDRFITTDHPDRGHIRLECNPHLHTNYKKILEIQSEPIKTAWLSGAWA